jgi:hypothetical protein
MGPKGSAATNLADLEPAAGSWRDVIVAMCRCELLSALRAV